MTRPVQTKNDLLGGLTITAMSLHTAYPGTTGANEVTGGSYARQAVTINPASGGQRLMSGSESFSVPATTVRYIGFWNNSTFVEAAPNGGFTPKNFMSVSASDLIYSEAHGYTDGTPVVFINGTPPAPLVEGTVYFVRDALTDSFRVAATVGGAAINLTAPTSFGCVLCRITEDVYASPGTHTVNTAAFVIPD